VTLDAEAFGARLLRNVEDNEVNTVVAAAVVDRRTFVR
jgi:hypothetical protein